MKMVQKEIVINGLSFPYELAEYETFQEMTGDLSAVKILEIVNTARNKRDREHYYRHASQMIVAIQMMAACFNITLQEAYEKYKTLRDKPMY